MNAVNAVLLFILVWTFSAVCQDDKDISVSCKETKSVGGKMLNCRVSLLIKACCIKNYMFKYNDFCRKVLPNNSCERDKIFTCSYPPNKTTTEFFVQASCGWKSTVNITETLKPELLTEVITPGKTEEPAWDVSETSERKKAEGRGFKIAIITAVISCLIIIIMPIIYRITQKHPKQKRAFLVYRHDEDNSNHPENVI